ncbi:hypothetical protein ASPWEDRAFT_109001 [Aspergillus wentii DTO 134E9]|uniref:Galactose oxidase-like Early set domain-containing protein n=1 Tax=Aspergillus wentii DTO 134E9 TaxID=1073089 RepID=A0A1L9RP41_ASPWE|nr:uncharacterized protein ASPWEDRAFT_109001 [Aspergillus wentii DTO 134E9]OJJ36709.1 hypothetical protein ASPWEDRAFT_109001 [Aspergillus wentii DTO 134E9]
MICNAPSLLLHLLSVLLPIQLIQLIHPVSAVIPYSSSYILPAPRHNESLAYVLRPSSNSDRRTTEFLSLDVSGDVDSASPQYTVLLDETPFQSDGLESSFIPVIDRHGIVKVHAGSCQNDSNLGVVWQFTPDNSSSIGNGTWQKLAVSTADGTTDPNLHGPNFLAAGFTYASTNTTDSFIYTFGGMCPFHDQSGQSWMSAASYSQSMTVLNSLDSSPSANTAYRIATTGHRAPPIPEAGFTITPLQATYAATSTGSTIQQQDFLLTGGQTQQAFINMSELAIFSLPHDSWSFVTVESELDAGKAELALRDTITIEPRSGHTAVLTPDGSKVVVFGGWVGDSTVPASPQLVILEIGMEYGGSGPWTWKIPSTTGSGLAGGAGIYGHGATMLPGGVMMVTGGYSISQSSKRSTARNKQNSQVYFFNTTSNSWDTSYTNPSYQAARASKSNSKSRKTGLGVGLGLGIPAVTGIAVCGWLYMKRQKVRRRRDNELRKLALGAQRSHFWGRDDPNMASSIRGPSMRGNDSPISWANSQRLSWQDAGEGSAERTGLLLDIPSPTKSSRQSLNNRSRRYSNYSDLRRSDPVSDIHPIDEREEDEAVATEDPASPTQQTDQQDLERAEFLTPQSTNIGNRLSIRAAARSMEFRPSLLPQGKNGRSSPDRDNRTPSNLSEASANSSSPDPGVAPEPRSTTLGIPSSSSNNGRQSPEKPGSASIHSKETTRSRPDSATIPTDKRYSSDSYSTAQSTFSHRQAEGERLLGEDTDLTIPFEEPNELPLEIPKTPRKVSIDLSPKVATIPKPKTPEWMGSIRRVLSGRKWILSDKDSGIAPIASGVDRRSTVLGSSKASENSENGIGTPRRAVSASAELFRRKQGAKDWAATDRPSGETLFQTARSTRDNVALDGLMDAEEDSEWDVEGAAEGRRVQVTFTVPKERLRVVNATAGDMDNVSERSASRSNSGTIRERTVSR